MYLKKKIDSTTIAKKNAKVNIKIYLNYNAETLVFIKYMQNAFGRKKVGKKETFLRKVAFFPKKLLEIGRIRFFQLCIQVSVEDAAGIKVFLGYGNINGNAGINALVVSRSVKGAQFKCP